jgi:hypothetical protein
MEARQTVPLETCMPCLEGAPVHFGWHPTRAALLKIGHEMTGRVRERERWCVRQMDDPELVGYGARMRRLLVTARADDWPDYLVEQVAAWVDEAEREWRWRRRAARLGADAVQRSGASWADRVDQVKRLTDLLLLIGAECGEIKTHGPVKFSCRCPFHDDRYPSLDIDTVKAVWLCRACTIGGDAITYVELSRSVKFPAAVQYLEERLGIMPPAPVSRMGAPLGGVPIVT